MAKWQYTGDESLVFPTLGLTVSNGDVFEGPDNLTANGVIAAGAKAKVSATVPVVAEDTLGDATPAVDATATLDPTPAE